MNEALDTAENIIEKAKRTEAVDLYLSYQSLTELPASLFELKNLETLVLSGNELVSIHPAIAGLKKLKMLDISGNQLERLPTAITRLEDLNRLDLASNQLKELPEEIGSLRNLTHLDCFGNQLTSLPDSVCDCVNLIELRIAENNLWNLPNRIGHLQHLTTLDLNYNDICELPESFQQLKRLLELYLVGNRLNLSISDLNQYTFEPEKLIDSYFSLIKEQQRQKNAKNKEQNKSKATTNLAHFISKQKGKFTVNKGDLWILTPTEENFDCRYIINLLTQALDQLEFFNWLTLKLDEKTLDEQIISLLISNSYRSENTLNSAALQTTFSEISKSIPSSLKVDLVPTNHSSNNINLRVTLREKTQTLFFLTQQIRQYLYLHPQAIIPLDNEIFIDAIDLLLKSRHIHHPALAKAVTILALMPSQYHLEPKA